MNYYFGYWIFIIKIVFLENRIYTLRIEYILIFICVGVYVICIYEFVAYAIFLGVFIIVEYVVFLEYMYIYPMLISMNVLHFCID